MKGSVYLKTAGILMVVFSVISLLSNFIMLVAADYLTDIVGNINDIWIAVSMLVGFFVICVPSAVQLFTGIMGIKYHNDKDRATYCMTWGIITLVLEIIFFAAELFLNHNMHFVSVVVFVVSGILIPVFYIIGSSKK